MLAWLKDRPPFWILFLLGLGLHFACLILLVLNLQEDGGEDLAPDLAACEDALLTEKTATATCKMLLESCGGNLARAGETMEIRCGDVKQAR